MPKSHALAIRLRHQPKKNDQISPISRQWEMLQLLSNEKEGSTVEELAEKIGVSSKTIRRHLLFFKHLGFDLQATENVFGLKRWRICHIFESLTTKQKQYSNIVISETNWER